MERIIIRTHARGPLGFVRLAADGADAGVTYAAVRSAIAEQLFEVILDEAYVFLLRAGGRRASCTKPGGDRASGQGNDRGYPPLGERLPS